MRRAGVRRQLYADRQQPGLQRRHSGREQFFEPTGFAAATGATVTWFWSPGGVTHNIVFDDNAPGSGNKSSGTFARTFTTAGTYPFHCSIHGAAVMSGTVTVGGGGSTGGGTGGGGGGGGGPTDGGGYNNKS